MMPGAIAVTATPRSPTSPWSARVNATRPPFAAQYAVAPFAPINPQIEDMLTTRPHPAAIIPGRTRRAQRNGPVRSTSMCRRQTSAGCSTNRTMSRNAALLTRISTGPSDSSTARTMWSTCS